MFKKAYGKIDLSFEIKSIDEKKGFEFKAISLLTNDYFNEVEIVKNDSNKIELRFLEIDNSGRESYNLSKEKFEDKFFSYLKREHKITNGYSVKIKTAKNGSKSFYCFTSTMALITREIFKTENLNIEDLNLKFICEEFFNYFPFFLSEYECAYVTGLGEEVEKINVDLNNYKMRIIDSKIDMSQKQLLSTIAKSNYKKANNIKFSQIIENLENGNFDFSIFNNITNIMFHFNKSFREWFYEQQTATRFAVISGLTTIIICFDKLNKIDESKIRTRYAPSPTGYLHIGGARTALFNYLFAKHHNGDFIIRIEDTDIERNVKNGIESQINNLNLLKIIEDESILKNSLLAPYVQTEKLNRYKLLANMLIFQRKAYLCFCSKEQLEKDREEAAKNHQTPRYNKRCLKLNKEQIKKNILKQMPYVYRLKIEDSESYSWDDLIRGKITVPGHALTDPVIMKSNGIPTYNFAVVIDDNDMRITHILRGEEHISNTPYQIAIKNALRLKSEFVYGHLSVIIDETGKKLSKRNLSIKQFISEYIEEGFVAQSITNFLLLLGWSSDSNKEIFSMEEMAKEFNTKNISKSPAFFDVNKLKWMSNEYFKRISDEEYLSIVRKYIQKEISVFIQSSRLDDILLLFKKQIFSALELNNLITTTFIDQNKTLTDEQWRILDDNIDVVQNFYELLIKAKTFDEETIKEIIKEVQKITNKKSKDLYMPIRISTTKLEHGPELAKNIYLLGKQQIILNLKNCLKL